MGMILGGVTFILATILGALRTGGGRVQQALGVPITTIQAPMTAKVFPMLFMMEMMVMPLHLMVGIQKPVLKLLKVSVMMIAQIQFL